jgi:hypothetical protein
VDTCEECGKECTLPTEQAQELADKEVQGAAEFRRDWRNQY